MFGTLAFVFAFIMHTLNGLFCGVRCHFAKRCAANSLYEMPITFIYWIFTDFFD